MFYCFGDDHAVNFRTEPIYTGTINGFFPFWVTA